MHPAACAFDILGTVEWYDLNGRALNDRPLHTHALSSPATATRSAQCADDARQFKLWWNGDQLDVRIRAFRELKFALPAE